MWVYFLLVAVSYALTILKIQETALAVSDGQSIETSFSYSDLSETFLRLAAFLLMLTIFFWTFVAANRLWPIKGKDNKTKSELSQD
jgi:hypothetical protein